MEQNDAEDNTCYEADEVSAAIFPGGGIQRIVMKEKAETKIFNNVGKVTTVLTVKMPTLLFGLLEFCSLQTDHVN
jgi:hypothetical protein